MIRLDAEHCIQSLAVLRFMFIYTGCTPTIGSLCDIYIYLLIYIFVYKCVYVRKDIHTYTCICKLL